MQESSLISKIIVYKTYFLIMTRSGRLYRKSGKMASEELASFLYNLACRYYIIFDFLHLSGLSCVHFIP